MSNVRNLHGKAMELAQLAIVSRENGDIDKAIEYSREASYLEGKAAELIPFEENSEPTRSILFLSAGSLSLQAKDIDQAERFAHLGLSGFPPDNIRFKLKNLYKEISYLQYLSKKGLELDDADLNLSFDGDSIGYGIIEYPLFERRMRTTHNIIDRTTQRKLMRVYQKSGGISSVYNPFSTAVLAPERGSFKITLRIIQNIEKQGLLLITPKEVIEDIIQGVELISEGKFEILHELIPDTAYYNNFVAGIKELAPDGEKISLVSFSTKNKTVHLDQTQKEIQAHVPQITSVEISSKRGKITGILDFASKRKRKDLVGITTDDGTEVDVKVTEGMDDIVKSYFDQRVTVTGPYEGKLLVIEEIIPSE